VLSVTCFVLTALDKFLAGGNTLRVPEVMFYLLALAGGTPGLLIGMFLFKHKTKKEKFHFFLAMVLLAQLIAARYVLYKVNEPISLEPDI
jgi:uncharacterized membrane protein YsdA (DUF1294 family)